jgi:serine/threonine protein kinase
VLSQVAELVVEAKRSLPGPALRNLVRGELKFDEFEIERKISSGGFCTVFRAKLRKSGRPCAVKSFSSADSLGAWEGRDGEAD